MSGLRNRWLLGIGGALILVGLAALAAGAAAAAARNVALMGVFLVVAGFLVGPRYRPEVRSAPEGFVPTGEHFKDPGTGRPIAVYEHPSTGERVYVLQSGNGGNA